MQATWPRVLLAQLQLGLGVKLYHHFASWFLIDSFHHHGFAVPTKKFSSLSKMLLNHMELTFPTWQQNLCSMELIMLTTISAHWTCMAPFMACCCDSEVCLRWSITCKLSWCGYCWKSADSLPQGREFWNVKYQKLLDYKNRTVMKIMMSCGKYPSCLELQDLHGQEWCSLYTKVTTQVKHLSCFCP